MKHTYALLPVSQSTYDEIGEKLRAAGYDEAFHQDDSLTSLNGQVIDMHGIALSMADEPSPAREPDEDEGGKA